MHSNRQPLYPAPAKDLTKKEKLQAALVILDQRIPGGYQTAMPLHIDASIKQIEELFPTHNLPKQQELITQLEAWRLHITQGQKYSDLCTALMQDVFDDVRARPDDAAPLISSE